MKIASKDRPVVLALLAIPLALFLTLATLRILPPEPPKQQQTTNQAQQSSGEKTSVLGWLSAWNAEDFIALFTLMTLGAIAFQLAAMRRANDHFRVTERAYVKMSHEKPGIDRYIPELQAISVKVQIKNFGRSPARTTTIGLQALVVAHLDDIPERPRYSERYSGAAFLVAEDNFVNGVRLFVPRREWAEVQAGRKYLVVYGYVDYFDQFDVPHRAGYGRRYEPQIDVRPADATDKQWEGRNNLHFLADRLGYNYDLPLSAKAWDDEPNQEQEALKALARLNREYQVPQVPENPAQAPNGNHG